MDARMRRGRMPRLPGGQRYRQQTVGVDPLSGALLVDATTAAELCGLSRSGWWSLHAAGRVPLPVRLGRRTLWRARELAEWSQAGCPARDRWEALKGGQKR